MPDTTHTAAQTIIDQLGGNRFRVMTGAKLFTYSHFDGLVRLTFSIGRNPARVNQVTVRLNGMDLYDLDFNYVRAGRVTFRSSAENVYAEDLEETFENHTGLYLTLMPRRA